MPKSPSTKADMIDIHCHILPGLDDGSKDMKTSIAMARIAAADGIREIVATPHVFDSRYECTRTQIERVLEELRAELASLEIPLELHIGADTHLDERIFQEANAEDVIPIADGKYLVIELPHELVPPRAEETLFRLRTAGYIPIITHPERNAELKRDRGLERLAAWVETGTLLQVTGGSLTGEFGSKAEALAREIIRRGLCHFVATDAHSASWRKPILSEARLAIEKLVGQQTAFQLVSENPSRAIRGEPVEKPPGLSV